MTSIYWTPAACGPSFGQRNAQVKDSHSSWSSQSRRGTGLLALSHTSNLSQLTLKSSERPAASEDLGLPHPKVPGSFQDSLQPASSQIISTKSGKYQNKNCIRFGHLNLSNSVLFLLSQASGLACRSLLRQRMAWPKGICSQH